MSGRSDEIRLVRKKEVQHRAVRRGLSGGLAQCRGAEAGEIQEALRTGLLGEDPCERFKRYGVRV